MIVRTLLPNSCSVEDIVKDILQKQQGWNTVGYDADIIECYVDEYDSEDINDSKLIYVEQFYKIEENIDGNSDQIKEFKEVVEPTHKPVVEAAVCVYIRKSSSTKAHGSWGALNFLIFLQQTTAGFGTGDIGE